MRARSLPFLFLIPLFLFAGPAARAADWLYLTVAGDTLIGIGQKYLKNPNDWPKVRVVNQVGDPKKLPTGSHLRIPVELLKVTPAPVEVTAASGNVRYRRADGPFQALAAGTRLHGGETVLTGPRSSAAFRFADGTVLTQQASSRIGFGRLAAWGATGMVATEINLEAGRLEASAARQQAPAGGFKVVTPVAVAGLRGTGFRLNLDEDGKTLRGEVTEGAVAIAAQGEEVRVEGGYGTITELGKPPRAPRPLLARPDLSGLPDARTTDALAFTWPADPAARSWRAQIAADAGFHDILLDSVFTAPEARWPEPEAPMPGRYHLRARAIDADGLEGFSADHAFVLAVAPPPAPVPPPPEPEPAPLPAAPSAPEMVEDGGFLIANWRGAATVYRMEIGRDPAFATIAASYTLPSAQARVRKPAPGDYWVRVIAIDARGVESAPSPATPVTINQFFPWLLLPFLLLMP